MKKITKILISFVLCICTVFTLTACGTNLSKTTADTTDVISNGGVSVYHDGWVYFINGTKEVSDVNVKGVVVNGGIYRVKADENGNILYETQKDENGEVVKDSDGNEVKQFKEMQPVINKLVGFKYGSLNIYGDFLYYTTPCTDKNKAGEMLTGKTEFRRYDLVSGIDQLLYKTTASDDELTYGFVLQDEKLYLEIFEKNSATLTSLLMGDKVTTAFTKTDVKSVLLSENKGTTADGYVYFTLSYDKDDVLKRGVKVYKTFPDGNGEVKMSEGKAVTLLTVKAGRLVYAYDSAVYSIAVTDGEDTLKFTSDNVVCTKNYENIIFLEDNGKLSVLVCENNVLRLLSWGNGELTWNNIYEFDADDKIAFLGIDGDFVVYTNSNKVYKSRFKNITNENKDEMLPIQLSITEIVEADELLAPEIVNGYLYAFSKNSITSKTYLFRISLTSPENVTAAEFIGKVE